MPQSDKVQSSEQGKIRLRQVLQERKLTEKITQDEVAKQANVSLDTVKRLLGTKECPNGVERWAVSNLSF
jgi:DNA-binding transcriptional regulator LsrR (DeoR family)